MKHTQTTNPETAHSVNGKALDISKKKSKTLSLDLMSFFQHIWSRQHEDNFMNYALRPGACSDLI